MNRQWKKYDQLTEKCYQGMAVGGTNVGDWNDCFDILIRIIENERESNPDFGRELELLDDETDYRHDVQGWLEDYLDELFAGDSNYVTYLSQWFIEKLEEENQKRLDAGLDIYREPNGEPVSFDPEPWY